MDTQKEKLTIDFEWRLNDGVGLCNMIINYDNVVTFEIEMFDHYENHYNNFMELINFNEQDPSLKYKNFKITSKDGADIFFKIKDNTIYASNNDYMELSKNFTLNYKPNDFKKFMEYFDKQFMTFAHKSYNIELKKTHSEIIVKLCYEEKVQEAINYINSIDDDETKTRLLNGISYYMSYMIGMKNRDNLKIKEEEKNKEVYIYTDIDKYKQDIIDKLNNVTQFEKLDEIKNKISEKIMNKCK